MLQETSNVILQNHAYILGYNFGQLKLSLVWISKPSLMTYMEYSAPYFVVPEKFSILVLYYMLELSLTFYCNESHIYILGVNK